MRIRGLPNSSHNLRLGGWHLVRRPLGTLETKTPDAEGAQPRRWTWRLCASWTYPVQAESALSCKRDSEEPPEFSAKVLDTAKHAPQPACQGKGMPIELYRDATTATVGGAGRTIVALVH